jgi:hypothetical protein
LPRWRRCGVGTLQVVVVGRSRDDRGTRPASREERHAQALGHFDCRGGRRSFCFPGIGRGLMEAVPTADITFFAANVNPDHPERENGTPNSSTLGDFTTLLGCLSTGCISGKANMIPRNFTAHTATTDPENGTVTGFVGGVGRFGLRANGVELL